LAEPTSPSASPSQLSPQTAAVNPLSSPATKLTKQTKQERRQARLRALSNATPAFLADELFAVREQAKELKFEEESIKELLKQKLKVPELPPSAKEATAFPELMTVLRDGIKSEDGDIRLSVEYVTQTRFSAEKARQVFADQPDKLEQCNSTATFIQIGTKKGS
jgi:hypothetical protein